MTKVPVGSLAPGTVCRLDMDEFGHIDYRVIYSNQCRSHVQPLSRNSKQVVGADGSVLAEFDAPSGAINIAPMTMVIKLDQATAGTIRQGAPSMPRNGKSPQIPKRPPNFETKRGKVIKFLLADPVGETPIKDVMAEFGMDRSAVLTYCHEIHRDHGYGYTVIDKEIIRIEDPLPDEAAEFI